MASAIMNLAIPDCEMCICILYPNTVRIGRAYVPIGYDVRVGRRPAPLDDTTSIGESPIPIDQDRTVLGILRRVLFLIVAALNRQPCDRADHQNGDENHRENNDP
jgi:hypothetical protein